MDNFSKLPNWQEIADPYLRDALAQVRMAAFANSSDAEILVAVQCLQQAIANTKNPRHPDEIPASYDIFDLVTELLGVGQRGLNQLLKTLGEQQFLGALTYYATLLGERDAAIRCAQALINEPTKDMASKWWAHLTNLRKSGIKGGKEREKEGDKTRKKVLDLARKLLQEGEPERGLAVTIAVRLRLTSVHVRNILKGQKKQTIA